MATKRVATDEEMAEDAIATATEKTEFTRVRAVVDGHEYVLEYSRAAVKQMERGGFNVDAIGSMPATMLEELIVGAFTKNHPRMSRRERLAVWEALGGKSDGQDGSDGLISTLVKLYMVPVNSLMADPTTTTATWTVE